MTSRRRTGPRWRALWAHTTARQRVAVVSGAVALVVCAVLASLAPAGLPVVLAVLVADAVLAARLHALLLRRWRDDRRISDEAARGQRELERWLAFGEHA